MMADKQQKSRYARKEAWRKKNCGMTKYGPTPLPFFPEIMALPAAQKPWGAD